MPIRPILSEADRNRVTQAVMAAEAHTAGEVVTILTDRSDGYSDIALAWSALMGFLALAALTIAPQFYLGIYEWLSGGWLHHWSPRLIFGVALLVATLQFAAIWLLQQWQPLKFLLIPRSIRNARVRARAITCFRVGAERRTHGRTGVLIYLSMREHRAEIVADEAIAARVAPEVWGDAMAAMIAHIRNGEVAKGMCVAVERVGVVLAEHFPRAEDDRNELPDRLIEV